MAASRFQLDAGKIEETVVTLARRIQERFPQSGLHGVCQHLHSVAAAARKRALEIQRPIVSVRIASALMIAGVLVMLGYTVKATLDLANETGNKLGPSDFVQMLDAAINSVVLVGATVLFLVTLESRIKRRRALRALHELRAIAHVIDMHQLTKDPQRAAGVLVATPSSPTSDLSPDQLIRYLDYCSEMLSLVGKLAALYLQRSDDAVVLSTVDEIEGLTTGFSRKIWQKLMIIHAGHADGKK